MATKKEKLQARAADLKIDVADLTIPQLEEAIAEAEAKLPPGAVAPEGPAGERLEVVWVKNTTKTLLVICDDKRTRLGPGPHPIAAAAWAQAVKRAEEGGAGKPPNKGMALMLDMGQLVEMDEVGEQYATTLTPAEQALLKGEKEPDDLKAMGTERALMTIGACEVPAKLQAWAKADTRSQVKQAIAQRLGDLKKLTVAAKKK